MHIEIERKFLVNELSWQQLPKPAGEYFRQGYLVADAEKTIRVRETPDKGFITIKGVTSGVSRHEYEYEIPKTEAALLLNEFARSEIAKTRYRIIFADKCWEVDVFSGRNAGLIVAEIELDSENEPFELPHWIAQEVTSDDRYYNANLSIHPYTEWEHTQ